MAADSDGCYDDILTTIVTCEGNLADPGFKAHFRKVVGKLGGILGDVVKVHKLEPWNSVRVTLSIPREAALRLRRLATESAAQLRALGILSVQVEGDQVISLRIASSVNSEPQEILLQTTQDGVGNGRQEAETSLGRFLSAATMATATTSSAPPTDKVQFKSPNVVCPPDSVVPKVPVSVASNSAPPTVNKGPPFPFASMNQAIHTAPPPPYPGKHPISSPLLVNLLQNDGSTVLKKGGLDSIVNKVNPVTATSNRTNSQYVTNPKPNLPPVMPTRTTNFVTNRNTKPLSVVPKQNSLSSTSSPSALTNTSIIRQNNNKQQQQQPNSTISANFSNVITSPLPPPPPSLPLSGPQSSQMTRNLPPPPPYSVAVNRPWDSLVQTTSSALLDLTPSLTGDDLEHFLPTLERDLARSPPEIPEELTRSEDKRNFLINPLTGELEPPSAGESDTEMADVFTGLASPADLSDEDTNSTIRPDTTDQSDSETRSSHSDSGKHRIKSKVRERGRDSPNLKPTEKIKLRLKLEKSEPVNSAYKVDVSFIQQPKKATTSEELRVPPLHISLRGKKHAYITTKKNAKLNPDKAKLKKTLEDSAISNSEEPSNNLTLETNSDPKKLKKFKANHEHIMQDNTELISKLVVHNYKDKQKERRGSDSDLTRSNMKFYDSNGIISVEKKRRLSQSEITNDMIDRPPILGSTNIGTIAGLPQKIRKDKNKIKEAFKNKESPKTKTFTKTLGEKFSKQVSLPTGEIDMEAKFKQRLLEGTEKGVPRPPHRTETVNQIIAENSSVEKADQVIKTESEPPPINKEKSPEPDKCNTPDRKQTDMGEKPSSVSRSPTSGAQGEDSGIESMDALSEKSPNQASQSPHADIPEPINKSKTQVPDIPDMLDIEAQLAKMEGLNGVEDMNENQHVAQPKLSQCCELTSALQDSLKQGAVSLSVNNTSSLVVKDQLPSADVNLVPAMTKPDENLEPLPVRVTPPLYTYSNSEKGRGSESPTLSDEEDTSLCNPTIHKTKSLLEQLLIEIPDNLPPSSPSPATRSSVRTRALSKLNSPELNSPVTSSCAKQQTPIVSITTTALVRSTTPATTAKRKRQESDSSTNSTEDARNKKSRRCSENAAELIKACMGLDASKVNNINNKKVTAGKSQEESSDSDEPLIEKVRKTTSNTTNTNNLPKNKVKSAVGVGGLGVGGGVATAKNVITRRSVRATVVPTPNTRSKVENKLNLETEAIRRKTRSAVSDTDNKRKKEAK